MRLTAKTSPLPRLPGKKQENEMAFESKDLSVLAYANGFTLWHYTTRDGDVGAGYFDEAADMLRPGDVIVANVNAVAERRLSILHVVSSGDRAVAIDEAA